MIKKREEEKNLRTVMYFKCPVTEKLVKETGRKEIKTRMS